MLTGWLQVLLVAGSFALAAAWMTLWIRSYSASDTLHFSSPHGTSIAYTCRGGVGLLTQPSATPGSWEWGPAEFGNPPEPFRAGHGPGKRMWFGIRGDSYFTSMARNAWVIAVPLWLFVVVSLLPAAGVVLYRFGKRFSRGSGGRGFGVTGGPAAA